MNVAIGVASGHTAELYMDPFLARDDVALAKDVGEVLLVWEGIPQRDLTSDGEGKIARWHGGAILDRTARPGALDETNGRACDCPLNGSANSHDDARGRAAMHLNEGSSAVLTPKGSFAVGVGEAAIAGDDEASCLNDRGTGFRGRRWLGGGAGGTGKAGGSRACSLGKGDGRGGAPREPVERVGRAGKAPASVAAGGPAKGSVSASERLTCAVGAERSEHAIGARPPEGAPCEAASATGATCPETAEGGPPE